MRSASETSDEIRSEPAPICYVCGSEGKVLFDGVTDRLYDTPGVWRLRRCGDCGLVWLDPRPRAAELGRLYRTYYTHVESDAEGHTGAFR